MQKSTLPDDIKAKLKQIWDSYGNSFYTIYKHLEAISGEVSGEFTEEKVQLFKLINRMRAISLATAEADELREILIRFFTQIERAGQDSKFATDAWNKVMSSTDIDDIRERLAMMKLMWEDRARGDIINCSGQFYIWTGDVFGEVAGYGHPLQSRDERPRDFNAQTFMNSEKIIEKIRASAHLPEQMEHDLDHVMMEIKPLINQLKN